MFELSQAEPYFI